MNYLLSDKWVLWAHLPHDTDWSLKSYYSISNFDTLNECILLNCKFEDKFIINCMLFLMKDGINPMWEDPNNRNGGCFSFKVNNNEASNAWKQLFYSVVCNQISDNNELNENICGITISPKKSFCIIKIWLKSCKFQNPQNITTIKGLNLVGGIFKKHV